MATKTKIRAAEQAGRDARRQGIWRHENPHRGRAEARAWDDGWNDPPPPLKPTKAITIWQPWAWCILHLGKDVENRTWPTKHRGPIAIHAAAHKNRLDYEAARRWIKNATTYDVPLFDQVQRGAIIGIVSITSMATNNPGTPWWMAGPNHVAWILEQPHATLPQPAKGKQRIWTIPNNVIVEYEF